jgi:hypothetical protein
MAAPAPALGDDRLVEFGIVGGGYWTERYLMVCRELPQRFKIAGMVVLAISSAVAMGRLVESFRVSEFGRALVYFIFNDHPYKIY